MLKQFFSLLLLATIFISCGSGGSDNTYTPPPSNAANDITSMTFNVSIPDITPSNEFICIDFDDLNSPLIMNKTDVNTTWTRDINQSDINQTNSYKYCRNCECNAADENETWRNFNFQANTTQEDTVSAWRWLDKQNLNFELNTTGYITQNPDINRTFITGVLLNDWWKHQWIYSFDTTMQEISTNTSSKWIQITPVSQIININDENNISIIQVGVNGINDEDLNKSIQLAHNRGLKVFLNPSLWSFEEDHNISNHSQTWWDNFHKAWKPVLLHYAQLAQENNVEMLEFKMWYDIDSINDDEANKSNDLALDLLNDVNNTYNGLLATQSICYDTSKPILSIDKENSIDYLAINIWSYYPWHLGDSKDDNVTQIYNNIDSNLTQCHNFYTDNNITKPIIIEQLSSASYDGAIIGAISDDEAIDTFHEKNDSVILDLQEQADVYEATLRAISQKTWINGSFAFTYLFWDSIGPDINIRAKPAEKIIQKWYNWFNDSNNSN